MTIRVGINGFGRIGRTVFRILADRPDVEVVVINDLFDNDHLAYLLKYDTVMGVFEQDVSTDAESMTVDGRRIRDDRREGPGEDPVGRARRRGRDRVDGRSSSRARSSRSTSRPARRRSS